MAEFKEQHICINFYRLGKIATTPFKILKSGFGEEKWADLNHLSGV
jgi:hypothetical protein